MNEQKEVNDMIFQDFTAASKAAQPVETPEVEVKEGEEQNNASASGAESPTVDKSAGEPVDSKADGSEEKQETAKQDSSEEAELEWDSFIKDTETTDGAKPEIDFSAIGEAVGFAGIKTQEEFVSKIKELQSSKEKEVNTTNLPDELAEAIEIAKNNGDYLAYLGVAGVDYESSDPIELYEDEVAAYFTDSTGKFDEDGYYDYIDQVSDVDKKLRGMQLKRELIAIQGQQKNQLREAALARKQQDLTSVRVELDKISDVGGFPIKDSIKKQIFEDFATGKYKEELGLVTSTGRQDFKRSIENYIKAKYFDAFQKFHEHKIKTAVKRHVHDELSNSTITSPSKLENPVSQGKKKEGVDLYLDNVLKNLNQ